MRISDWSSDVCSSDLAAGTVPFYRQRFAEAGVDPAAAVTWGSIARLPILKRSDLQGAGEAIKTTALPKSHGRRHDIETSGDRKSVVEGKSVSVRVDLGGRRIIKKKKKRYIQKRLDRYQ